MKNLFLFLLSILATNQAYSQLDGRFGITAGATNYITDTNLLFSKSGIGYSVGIVGTAEISDSFRVLIEINYNSHSTKFVGREAFTAAPEDIKFKMENFSVPFFAEYNFYEYEDFKFSVQAGPSLHLVYGYILKDETLEDYVLEPFYASPSYLEFDRRREQISINVFAAAGVSADYNDSFRLGLRYYYGITDPYRNAFLYSIEELSGQDSFMAIKMTYFLDN